MRIFNLSECATKPAHYNYKANVAFRMGLKSRLVLLGLFIGNDFADLGDGGVDEYLSFPYPARPLEDLELLGHAPLHLRNIARTELT